MPYTVSTWFDELMAVALAAQTHAGLHPRSPINSLFVEEIDPLPSADLKVIPEGEVINPNEWRRRNRLGHWDRREQTPFA